MRRAAKTATLWFSLCGVASACPVCGGGGENDWVFLHTTIFLSLTPLILLGSVVGFIWWKTQSDQRELMASADQAIDRQE
jgi:hypothetical protein